MKATKTSPVRGTSRMASGNRCAVRGAADLFLSVRPAIVLYAVVAFVALGGCSLFTDYSASDTMRIPVTEYSSAEYPEDPALRSVHYGRYADRTLTLIQRDETHFDFVFEPTHPHTATVAFRNIDVSLLTPTPPEWVKGDPDLTLIAMTDRQWNRQQVSFKPGTEHVNVSGGNGFERDNLFSAELAKNCLNAGLWEVLLFTQENGQKALYYQGWFTFPLGHYKRIFERKTGISYATYRSRLEHWRDPEGTPVDLGKLRQVQREAEVKATFLADEPIIAAGEQQRKARIMTAKNLLTWKDFYTEGQAIQFASFVKPGRYNVSKPWNHQYARLSRFLGAHWRDIHSPAADRPLQEVELRFEHRQTGEQSRFVVSGFDFQALPQLPVTDYPKGLYMPMGIGVPPFYQGYEVLQASPPYSSPYFSVLLDADNRWINHHEVAVDGVAMHRDQTQPDVLHLYLLSYERQSLIGHFVIDTTSRS